MKKELILDGERFKKIIERSEDYYERLKKLRESLPFEERVEKLKKNIGPELPAWLKEWREEKEENIKEFISDIIWTFEGWIDAGATNPLLIDISVRPYSLSCSEFKESVARLEKLGFIVEWFSKVPSTIYVALCGEESKIRNSSDFSDIVGKGAIGH